VEVRRFYPGLSTTGLLYGEALGTGWLSSQDKMDHGHHFFADDGWNALRIVARGPRIQTWVNGHAVEDLTLPAVYATHPKGFIGLQLHGINARDLELPVNAGSGVTVGQPLTSKWRNIRIRPLSRP
jgi:quinoprotein glucose dehydrogenase